MLLLWQAFIFDDKMYRTMWLFNHESRKFNFDEVLDMVKIVVPKSTLIKKKEADAPFTFVSFLDFLSFFWRCWLFVGTIVKRREESEGVDTPHLPWWRRMTWLWINQVTQPFIVCHLLLLFSALDPKTFCTVSVHPWSSPASNQPIYNTEISLKSHFLKVSGYLVDRVKMIRCSLIILQQRNHSVNQLPLCEINHLDSVYFQIVPVLLHKRQICQMDTTVNMSIWIRVVCTDR